jgi:hypothetical protein
MSDQIIDALMARAIQADAVRAHPLVGWIVMRDQPDYPDEMIARLVTDAPTPYVLRGHTLAEVQAQLRSMVRVPGITHPRHQSRGAGSCMGAKQPKASRASYVRYPSSPCKTQIG